MNHSVGLKRIKVEPANDRSVLRRRVACVKGERDKRSLVLRARDDCTGPARQEWKVSAASYGKQLPET